jgi:predicted transglutaminase-like cysteine proteinase
MVHTPGWKDCAKRRLKVGRRGHCGSTHQAAEKIFCLLSPRWKKMLQVASQGGDEVEPTTDAELLDRSGDRWELRLQGRVGGGDIV